MAHRTLPDLWAPLGGPALLPAVQRYAQEGRSYALVGETVSTGCQAPVKDRTRS